MDHLDSSTHLRFLTLRDEMIFFLSDGWKIVLTYSRREEGSHGTLRDHDDLLLRYLVVLLTINCNTRLLSLGRRQSRFNQPLTSGYGKSELEIFIYNLYSARIFR